MLVWNLLSNGEKYSQISGTASEINELLAEDRKVYHNTKITKKCVGRRVGQRIIFFKDCELNTDKEIRSIGQRSLQAIITGDYTNDSITFFLWERGLMNEARTELTPKGEDLITAWEK